MMTSGQHSQFDRATSERRYASPLLGDGLDLQWHFIKKSAYSCCLQNTNMFMSYMQLLFNWLLYIKALLEKKNTLPLNIKLNIKIALVVGWMPILFMI